MASRAGSTGIDASLYRRDGAWCTALVDVSLGTAAAREAMDQLPETVSRLLASQQANAADIAAMVPALVPAEGYRSPVARFVAVNNGEVVLNEIISGIDVTAPQVDCAQFPNLVPLARARGGQFPYLVAEVSRDGGEVRLHHSGYDGWTEERTVAGDVDEAHHAKKVPGRYSEAANQANTDEVWRRNAEEVAAQIEEMARENYARLIVMSGDVKARELVSSRLSDAHRENVRMLDQHTRTGGADLALFAQEVSACVAQVLANDIRDLADKVANLSGTGRRNVAFGFTEVVQALQQSQAATILVAKYQDDESLMALTAEPWLAAEDSDEHAELVVGSWPAPEVLLRATALTDSTLRYVPDGVLPHGVGIAALLRWPTGDLPS